MTRYVNSKIEFRVHVCLIALHVFRCMTIGHYISSRPTMHQYKVPGNNTTAAAEVVNVSSAFALQTRARCHGARHLLIL